MQHIPVTGERRGLFYEDLGSLDRYAPNLEPLIVVHPDVDRLMARDDYALQMQIEMEHQEQCIVMFDKQGGTFYLQSALGHRDVHRWLAGRVYLRLVQDIEACILPAVETVRFMKIPTRPPLQEIVTHFNGCRIIDCIWSYRKGEHCNDLTRNTLLIVVFASPLDARTAEDRFRQDRWFATLRATMEPMKSSKKNPTDAPNWEFFDFCRKMRCKLMEAIATNCLLAEVSQRTTPNVHEELKEKAAKGLLSIGSSMNKTNNVNTSNAVAVRPMSAAEQSTVRAVHAADPTPTQRVVSLRSQPRSLVVLRPPSRPQADERQAVILRFIVGNALSSFFEATTEAHPCRIWSSDAIIGMLHEAALRHPPLDAFIREQLDAAGERGTELRNLRNARDTTVFYGMGLQRHLPVFVEPVEYQGRIRGRTPVSWIRTIDNIALVIDALQSSLYVAVSLRANQGFEPAVRLLSIAVQSRAFVVDLMACPVDNERTQEMLAALLEVEVPLCFESQRETIRFRSLCTTRTAETFDSRLRGVGFLDPYKVLQKCPLTPAWEPSDRAMLRLNVQYRELELYTVTYLGAILNTAYDNYLYCVLNLNGVVATEAKLRAIAMAMILRRCVNETPAQWAQLTA